MLDERAATGHEGAAYAPVRVRLALRGAAQTIERNLREDILLILRWVTVN